MSKIVVLFGSMRKGGNTALREAYELGLSI